MAEPCDHELPAVPDVQVLRLRPGDILIVTMLERLGQDDYVEIGRRLKERFPDNPALVLECGTLSVLRKED